MTGAGAGQKKGCGIGGLPRANNAASLHAGCPYGAGLDSAAKTGPEDILPTYERVAERFGRKRDKSLFERAWLDRFIAEAPGRSVLDLGCGTGEPIAVHLIASRCAVTGVYGAAAMLAQFRHHLPSARAIRADMRGLALGRRFDAILVWNSFFHLSPPDQRGMLPVFRAHAAPGAILMFTSGPGPASRLAKPEVSPSTMPASIRRSIARSWHHTLSSPSTSCPRTRPAAATPSGWRAQLVSDQLRASRIGRGPGLQRVADAFCRSGAPFG